MRETREVALPSLGGCGPINSLPGVRRDHPGHDLNDLTFTWRSMKQEHDIMRLKKKGGKA
jgi:hypothetical protein